MNESILLAIDDNPTRQLLSRALVALDYETVVATDFAGVEKLLRESSPSLLILSATFQGKGSLPFINNLLQQFPTLPIVYLADSQSREHKQEALRAGIGAYLEPPIKTDEIIAAIKSGLERAHRLGDWLRRNIKQSTASLEKRLGELEVLLKISREINSSLELDDVLQNVVSAAVDLTNAEEGSLLLLDESGTELYMRAGHNFEQGFADSFRMPVEDTLAGDVIKSGKPLNYNKDKTHKIQTAYLIQALIYVPLNVRDRIIGVLGVDNRVHQMPFSERDTLLLSVLAANAAVAIENARLFKNADSERLKFEAVITNMNDALLMLDEDKCVQIMNRSMASALDLHPDDVIGRKVTDVLPAGDLLDLIESSSGTTPRHYEVTLENDHTYTAQNTRIPDVGTAITMQDISSFKEVNRLKDDFVHTVSHDLRSPLTAVLGYTELLERVGELNDTQRDFIKRIGGSISDITALIDNLLDLGRIEAGFDKERERLNLEDVIKDTLHKFENLYRQKEQIIEVDLAPNPPPILGNPLRLRQMCDNLIANAVKYTDKGKKIFVRLNSQANELILEIADQGPGIPLQDQTRIFEKFYRSHNVIGKESGSGLGLAIVKTIVENHQGRIWVESKVDEGSAFFVVLPTAPEE